MASVAGAGLVAATLLAAVHLTQGTADVGVGDLLRLLDRVEYVGFDISESYVRAGHDRFGDRGTFVHGDLDDLAAAVASRIFSR